MQTECSPALFDFARADGRAVVASFAAGRMTSDAGALLLGAADRAIGLTRRLAAFLKDGRNPTLTEHEVATLVIQRVVGIALGDEDLIDHEESRHASVVATLAGKSTLNRLELSCVAPSRYAKLAGAPETMETMSVDLFLDAHGKPPKHFTLELTTDDPLHGHQESRFFLGYCDRDCYCCLSLYVFGGRYLLAAKLRRSNIDAAAGALDEIGRIVCQIRPHWPRVRILLQVNGGFARGADGVVRGQPRREPVRSGAKRPPRRRDPARGGRGQDDR